ncbi:cytochrome c family protein [Shinella sp. H4-D48]|uniref:Cytochrome c family protein n=1 Tax=Shinella sedimenti TaxID=2919913 RepID=A0ABT0CIC2_9HYPH|nr:MULTISPECIES: cytochrome c family protein [Shinella]MCJ8148353.1 cytochrome c family protein [Shinella sedimenti]UNK39004.1 cytochrome c family protein [Shinella sp. H4-D48]
MKPLAALAALLCLVTPAFADGDAAAGAAVFRKCQACHSIEPVNRVGPTLASIVGRPVASVADYTYSPAMKAFAEGGKVWDEALLAEYLMAPKAMVPGTRMTFAGLRKAEEIANLIAFLKAAPAP